MNTLKAVVTFPLLVMLFVVWRAADFVLALTLLGAYWVLNTVTFGYLGNWIRTHFTRLVERDQVQMNQNRSAFILKKTDVAA